jgi:CRP/FNR family transcriptional regulator
VYVVRSGCDICPVQGLGICGVPIGAGRERPHPSSITVPQFDKMVPARRNLERPNERTNAVWFICAGWAATALVLPDGRRQILSFVLPGEIVSTSHLFRDRSPVLVEAITDVASRSFSRVEMKALLSTHTGLFESMITTCLEEKDRADQMIIHLGRRAAEGRIAGLILNLMERMERRGMVKDSTFNFPLRQQHIADAMGLTPVHVSLVMGQYRRAGWIELKNRSLTVLEPGRLRHAAEL